jgi:hypothetical protein
MLKLIALVALFAGFCWVGTHVQLGSRTLFGHLRNIAQTKESQELFDGTRASAQPLVDDVRRRIAGGVAPSKPATPAEEADSTDSSKPEAAPAKDETKATTSKKDELAHVDHHPPEHGPQGPQESLTPSERHRLRRLISSAEGASARQ